MFHLKFGNGNVTAVDGNKLTIRFDKAGEKRVVDSYVETDLAIIFDFKEVVMNARFFAPNVKSTSFNCPHCGALAHQYWFTLYADPMEKDVVPFIPDEDWLTRIKTDRSLDEQLQGRLAQLYKNVSSGLVFLREQDKWTNLNQRIGNLHISQCYSCNEFSVWEHVKLLWPSQKHEIAPNPDLPQDVKNHFDEARAILNLSPRGAAALLRLAIQKLCKYLGEDGENLNSDIARLVAKGLDIRIQKALDVVRVVGNNAVHPGQIDLADNPDTSAKLFVLVNLIADAMITQSKHIESMFESLPIGAKMQIEKRDKNETTMSK